MKIKKNPFIRMSVICLMMLAIVAAVMPAIHAQEAALRTTAQENGTEVVRFDYQGEDISVKVTLKDPADLPEDAQMSVTPVTITQALQSKLAQALQSKLVSSPPSMRFWLIVTATLATPPKPFTS